MIASITDHQLLLSLSPITPHPLSFVPFRLCDDARQRPKARSSVLSACAIVLSGCLRLCSYSSFLFLVDNLAFLQNDVDVYDMGTAEEVEEERD